MVMMRPQSAHQWLILILVSLLLAGRCSAQVPTTAAPTPTTGYLLHYELGVILDTFYYVNECVWIPSGVRITAVFSGSPAQQSGLRPGDIITAVNGWRVNSPQAFQWAIANSGGRVILQGQNVGTGALFQISAFPRLSQPVVATPFSPAHGPYAPGAPAYGHSGYYVPQAMPQTVPTARAPAAPAKTMPAPSKQWGGTTMQGTTTMPSTTSATSTTVPSEVTTPVAPTPVTPRTGTPGTDVTPPPPPPPGTRIVPPDSVPTGVR